MFSPIEFRLIPSRSLIYLILGSHFLALFSLYITDLELFVKQFLGLSTLLSLMWYLHTYGSSNHSERISKLRWNATRQEIAVRLGSNWLVVEKMRSAVVLPYAVVFRFDLEGRFLRQTLVVMCDGLCADDFRRLKVLALHGAHVKSSRIGVVDKAQGH